MVKNGLRSVFSGIKTHSTTNKESSIETWSRVWYTSAAIYFVGAIIYIFFASAELQPWAAVSESRSRARRDSDEPERAGDDRQPLLQDT